MAEQGAAGPLDGRAVLVTGAGGFLGGVVAGHFRRLGARVTAPARRDADLRDEAQVAALERMGPFDAVAHCAAVLPGGAADADLLCANLRMTLNLARLARQAGSASFLFASTCSLYGPVRGPADESAPPRPPHAYAVSKLACEHLLDADLAGSGVAVCSLRISAPYGPAMRADTVVLKFLRAAAEGRTIRLLGTGLRTQDFVYQDDVALGFARALARGASGVYNLSGNAPVTMRELAECAGRALGRPVRVELAGEDPQDGYRGIFPTARAERELGFVPAVPLQEGLARTARGLGLG